MTAQPLNIPALWRRAAHRAVRFARAYLVAAAVIAAVPALALANTCTSKVASGNWSAAGTWNNCGGVIPTSADSVTIVNGNVITMDTSPTVSSVTINSGGTLTENGTGRTLTLNTAAAVPFTNNGTFNAGSGTVVINGNATLTLTSGAITFKNLTLSPTVATSGKTYTFGAGAVNVTGNLTINPSAASALALTVNLGNAMTVGGLTTVTRTSSATSSFSTTASNFALTTSSMSIAAGGTFTANASRVTFTGTSGTLFTNAGTFTPGTSTVEFTGDGTATLTSNNAFTFNNLTLSPTITAARAYTFGTSALTISGAFNIVPNSTGANALTATLGAATTVTGPTTVQDAGSATATLDTSASNFALTTSSMTIAAGDTVNARASTLTLNGTSGPLLTNNGTFTAGTSIVNMTPDTSITLTSGNISFSTLTVTPTITAARNYTFGSGTIGAGNIQIRPTAASAFALNVALGGAMTVTNTLAISRITSATTVLDTTSSNYTVTAGQINTSLGGTFLANGSTVTLTGTTSPPLIVAGTFTAGTSRVKVQSDATVSLTSNNAITFYDLELSPTLTAGRTYTFGTSAVTVNHDLLINPDAASALALGVNLGAAATVGNDLTLTDTNSATSSLSTTASNFALTAGRITVGAGDTLTGNASTLTLNGTTGTLFTNNGTFTPGTSIVNMTPDASVSLTSGNITFSTLTVTPTITASRNYTFGSGTIGAGNIQIRPTAASAFAANVTLGGAMTVTNALQITRITSATSSLDTTTSNYAVTAGQLNTSLGGTFVANGSTITVTGATSPPFIVAGTFTPGTSRVKIQSDAAVTLTSNNAITFYDLELSPTITAARAYTFPATAPTINHDLSITPTAASAFALTTTMASALNLANGSVIIDGTGSATASLTTSGSNFALTADDLTIGSGDTLTANAATITLDGPSGTLFTNNGTFTAGTSIVNLKGDGDLTATAGNITFSTLTVTPTLTASRTYTFGTGTVAAANMTINPTAASAFNLDVDLGNTLTVTNGLQITRTTNATSNLDTGADNAVTAGTLSVQQGGSFTAHGSTVTLTATTGVPLTVSGTINPGTSVFTITGNAALTLTSGAITLNDLVLSPTITAARAYTFGSGAVTMLGDFTLNPSASAFALTVTMGSSVTVNGVTTITRQATATSALSTGSNFALETGSLVITSGGTLTGNASTINLDGTSGTLFSNSGTFTPGTSIVNMRGDGDVAATAGNITFSTLTVTPALTANRTYTFGSSTWTAANFTISPSAASAAKLDVALGTTTVVTNGVTVTATGSATSNLDTTVSNWPLTAGTLSVQPGCVFTPNGTTVNLTGTTGVPLTVSGTIVPGASTIVISGNNALTLTSGAMTLNNLSLAPTITAARAYTFGSSPLTLTGDLMINPTAASAFALTVSLGSSITVSGLTTAMGTTSGTSNLTTTASNFAFETGRLTVGTGGTFTANASTVRIDGPSGTLFTRTGTFTPGTSVVEFAPTSDSTLNSGTITFSTMSIIAPGVKLTAGAAVTITAANLTAGELDDGGFQIVGNAGGVFAMNSGAILSLGSAATATTFPTLFTAANCKLDPASTVDYQAGVAQTISGTPAYGHLTLTTPSGTPTKTLGAAVNVRGDLTINANNTLSTSGSNFGLTLWGNYTNNGTLTVNTASTTFRNTGPVALSGTLSGTSAFNTFLMLGAGTVTPGSALAINGPLTVSAGTLAGTQNVTVTGAVTGSGSAGTINFTGGTFEQRVAAAQTFGTNVAGANAWTFNNLTFSNSSASNQVVTANGTGTGSIVVTGTLAVGKTGDTNSTTLDMNTNDRNFDLNGSVLIAAKGVLSASNVTPLTVAGDWANGGVFTHNNGAVVFDTPVIHQLSGSTSFYTLRAITSGATVQFQAGSTNYVVDQVDFRNVGLFSSSNGSAWFFVMQGSSETLSGLIVRDSNASGGNEMDALNSTDVSNNTNWDFGAPGQITVFSASQSATGRAIKLNWLSPGNDGSSRSLVNSTFTIHFTTDATFAAGSSWNPTAGLPLGVSSVTISTTSLSPGTACETELTGLISGGTYYVRIWTNDARSLYSPLSSGATNWATVLVLGVSLSQSSLNFGSLTAGTTNVIATPITVTNTGNVTARMQLAINNPATWTAVTTGAGYDEFRLTGVFKSVQPASSDFDPTNDVITTSTTTASSTFYARDADADTEKAISIAPGASRNLWFRVEMPAASTTTNGQTVRLFGNATE